MSIAYQSSIDSADLQVIIGRQIGDDRRNGHASSSTAQRAHSFRQVRSSFTVEEVFSRGLVSAFVGGLSVYQGFGPIDTILAARAGMPNSNGRILVPFV